MSGQRESKMFFACRCSEPETQECDDILAFVTEKLDPNEHNLISRIVASLEWDYFASITGIAMDQWFGMGAETDDDREDGLTVMMQCDMVEDGFAWIWKAFYDKYGDKRDRQEVFDYLKEASAVRSQEGA